MNPSTAHAQVIVDELVRCGVTDAVLCPGSRSAPLAFALHAADAAGRLRLHVRIDERTAGFLALGLALRSGRAVPVVTTSGTAVANLHPAVLEASHAGVPLLVLTADRPPQLIGTGANQTVVQPGIFGDAVRLALTAAPASDPERENGPWRVRRRSDAGGRARHAPRAGAPEPALRGAAGTRRRNAPGRSARRRAVDRGVPAPGSTPTRCRSTPQRPTLVIAGAGAPTEVRGWGLPVIAEPASGVWDVGLRAGPWLLGALPDALLPTQVRGGGPPDPAPAGPAAARRPAASPCTPWRTRRAGAGPTSPGPSARSGPRRRGTPRAAGRRAGSTPTAAAAKALDAALDAPGAPGGLRLARALVDALPGDALLVVGSSNPIRDVSLAAVPRGDVTVLANRGVAGIDGTVSTAVGAALAHPGPAYALLGDLTLLHDTTGLRDRPGRAASRT